MRLSKRERETFVLFLEGHRQKEIANILDLSPKTVHTYIANIGKREKCTSTVSLVLLGLRAGVLRHANGDCPLCGHNAVIGDQSH